MKPTPLSMRPDGPMGRPFAKIMERMNAPSYEAVLDALSLQRGEAVLEVGFGTGEFLRRAATRMQAGYLAGVDPAPLMVEMATARLLPAPASLTIELREAGADTFDWPPGTFDAVAAIHSFQFWDAPEAALIHIRALLKPGGRLCLCLREHGKSPPQWLPNPISRAPDETSRLLVLLADCGFSNPHIKSGERRAVLVLAHAP
ncbi:MAG: class I SAM-dependent methyltransferase [Hyphomonas sp.]|nr:class I SAM-dependent methyltransferase [Hyphomonas sp.]